MFKNKENQGIAFAFLYAVIWGGFPVMVSNATHGGSPLAYGAITTLVGALISFFYMLLKGKLFELKKKKAYFSLLMITFFIVIIPYTLFFIGSSKTSGVNSSVLLLSEIIFMLIFTPFMGEKTTWEKLFGAMAIFVGAFLLLYKANNSFNFGDLLIILSTLTYPFGNFYSKKALHLVSPSTILFVRFLFGGLFILLFAFFFEDGFDLGFIISQNLQNILLTGLVLLGTGKILWYEALRRLDISKAISLAMTFPFFSLIFLVMFFGQEVSSNQWIGAAIMVLGTLFAVRRNSIDPKLTKYALSDYNGEIKDTLIKST